MNVSENCMVTFHYRLSDAKDGTPLESSYETRAKQYIHGVSEILEGLVNTLEGKSKGDEFDITIPPEKAYGRHFADKVGRIPLSYVYLPNGKPVKSKLKPGDLVQVRTEYGNLDGTVIKQGLKNVDIDANHPYAGKTLTFAVQVVDVRAATEEEISEESGCSNCSCC